MTRAAELGMTHLAQTNHGTLAGHREFQRAAKSAGIQEILGLEGYISSSDRFDKRSKASRQDGTNVYNHIGLLAMNQNGLNNLSALSTIGWTEGYYHKPRIDMEVLEQYNEDIIVTTGCISGLIAKSLENDLVDEAHHYAKEFKRIFGDRVFMELQGHNPKELNLGLLDIANKYDIVPVVSSDCHYARKEDLWIQEATLILSTNPKKAKEIDFNKSRTMDFIERFNYLYPNRTMTFQEYQIFLRSYDEHLALLQKHGIDDQPIKNTMIIADMIGEYDYHENLDLLPQPKRDASIVLREYVDAGMQERGLAGNEEYEARKEQELGIIADKNFDSYFLVLREAIKFCKENDIPIGARGSGASSMVNYAIGATDIDPLKHNLLFFRFLDPGRDDAPDVDTDISPARRSELKEFMTNKFTNVASIATFGRFKGKSSVKDAARVFQIPLGEVNKALKGADYPPALDWWEEWEKTEGYSTFNSKYPEVIDLAKILFGRIKTQGMHAGGLVVANDDISKYAPMQTAIDSSDKLKRRIPIIALDMEEAANVGFIKFDFLGLTALDIIDNVVKSVKSRKGIDIDLNNIDMEDANIYKMLSDGHTKGVFQVDATPYTNLLIKMGGIKNFEELAASNALVRPGAMNSSTGSSFIKRKNGQEKIVPIHEDFDKYVKDTYGTVLYQEQVMLAMTELAEMSMGDANKVRKIIGKKRDVKEFEEYKDKFIDGASKKVSRKVAERLWKDFEAHAGYSFNLSHSVAYSTTTYRMAWLKYYYPVDFMAALLKDEGDINKKLEYLMEAKRLGVKVKLPHVNYSNVGFEIQEYNGEDILRFGLSDIKYVGPAAAKKIIESRPYKSYAELEEVSNRLYSGINKRCLEYMNKVGAAEFEDNPKTGEESNNLYEVLAIPSFQGYDIPPKAKAQITLIEDHDESKSSIVMGMVRGAKVGNGWTRLEVVDESGAGGFFVNQEHGYETGVMYLFLVSGNSIVAGMKASDFYDVESEIKAYLRPSFSKDITDNLLKVVGFYPRTTKAGKKMADVVLCDKDKNLLAVKCWPTQYVTGVVKCRPGAVIDVKLRELDDGGYAISHIL